MHLWPTSAAARRQHSKRLQHSTAGLRVVLYPMWVWHMHWPCISMFGAVLVLLQCSTAREATYDPISSPVYCCLSRGPFA
jgi:hypothetical protein